MPRPPSDREALIAALAEQASAGAENTGQPEPEELLDFLAGRLDPEEEERVSRRLVASPEASRALLDLADLEAAGEAAGERPREVGTMAGWRDLQRRLPDAERRSRRLRTLLPAVAAGLLVSTLGLSSWVWRLQGELSRPLPDVQTVELATTRAGAEPVVALAPGGALRLVLHPVARCPVYRAEIEGPARRDTIDVKLDPQGNVSVYLPRPEPGPYNLRLHGCEPGREMEEHRLRVTLDDG